jgi:hypothetical protein
MGLVEILCEIKWDLNVKNVGDKVTSGRSFGTLK